MQKAFLRNPLNKLFKPQTSFQPSSRQLKSQSFYDVKDFLPEKSCLRSNKNNSISQQGNIKKTSKSISLYQKNLVNDSQNNINSSNNCGSRLVNYGNSNFIDEKTIEQKMNKLKELNFELRKEVNDQKAVVKGQSQEIQSLRKLVAKMNTEKQTKLKGLKMWSYKYHIEYTPRQRHKYELAIQTQDSYSKGQQGSLKAKDFEDIYRRLNSNPSTIQLNTNKFHKQMNINNIESTQNSTLFNPSNLNLNPTLTINRNTNNQKSSLFKLPKLQVLPRQNENRQNITSNSNRLIKQFSQNPMEINISKILKSQENIKQQCLQIYPVQEGYLEAIIGELLCGDQD